MSKTAFGKLNGEPHWTRLLWSVREDGGVMKTSIFSQEAPRHGQFSSIFSQLLKIFLRSDFERAGSECSRQRPPRDLIVGRSLLPCCSVKSGERTACGRSAQAWPAWKASLIIWAWAALRRARPFPMPMPTVPARSLRKSSSSCWVVARLSRPPSPFVLRTSSAP